MNDHSVNDVFHASGFLQGHDAEYVEQPYAQNSVD
jgi:2-oxoglutarate dehydrogenase E1 component